ncbi:MAG TPA: HD domain-containing protein [Candidatus Hypogeohydataceae bacterium YC40]
MVTGISQGSLYKKPDLTPEKTIRIAVSGDVVITKTEQKIIDTPAFQRLRRIKQLGTSYLVYPSAVHTRFEHSLGTLKMADSMVQKIVDGVKIQEAKGKEGLPTINEEDRQIIRLAALLHDIAQIPFGHTLEDESHVIKQDHDSDEARFNYFLAENKSIGRILLEQIGLQGYDLLKRVLKTKRKDIESLGDKAYISDIVKNTVCADLLDYLRRDAYYCNINLDFGDRFLNSLFLAPVKSKKQNGKDSIRLIIRVWKEKEKKHRRDIIDELVQLLNCRFYLGSAVYFHHAKIITSSIISRAVKQALRLNIFSEQELWDMGDDELLYRLTELKKR